MQKLTLLVPDDIYEGLHRQIGKGKISHFVSEKVRPYLLPAKTGTVDSFHGLFKDHAKKVSPEAEERAKRAFMIKRIKARQAAQ
ncbi:MAG: hypothetical protein ACKVQK_14085 [Burkholderiales bacterium]